jgi:hypothetical protein
MDEHEEMSKIAPSNNPESELKSESGFSRNSSKSNESDFIIKPKIEDDGEQKTIIRLKQSSGKSCMSSSNKSLKIVRSSGG